MLKPHELTTPQGTASWININDSKPDKGPDGSYTPTYKVDLIVSKDTLNASGFLPQAEQYHAAVSKDLGSEIRPLPIKEELDESGNPTGNLILKCKKKYFPERRDENGNVIKNETRVKMIGADNNPWSPTGLIGKGTKMQVALKLNPYNTGGNKGITFFIEEVRIIDVVYYGEGKSNRFGDAVEGNTITDEPKQEEQPEAASTFSDF